MRYSLRFLLKAYLLTLTVFGLLLSGWLWQQQRELDVLQQIELFTSRLDALTADLVYLAAEQNFQVNARTSAQWNQRMALLQQQLNQAPPALQQSASLMALKSSFARADLHKQQLMSAGNPRLRERYLLLLMTHTRQASADLLAVREQVDLHRQEISRARTDYTVAVLVVLLAFSLALSWFVWVRIKQPVNQLVEGLRYFKEGRLDQPLPDAEIEELQRIVIAGNEMAQSLAKMTVSRDALQAEVERRKTVEVKLHEREEQVRVDYMRRQDERERMIQIEKLSALGTMVGGVAHEINNPLMGVMNFVEYARDRATDEKSIKVLGSALDQIERIKQIVRNMLVFVSADAQQTASSDVRQAVEQTLALLEGEFKKHGIQVTMDWPEVMPLVQCGAGSLQQVLLNLLLNARDALAGQTERRIHLHWEQQSARGLLYVCDNGPGVPVEVQDRIFEPFFTTKPAGQGTGLGLSVSQRLIEAAGGRISMCNNRYGDFCMLLEFGLL